MEKWVNELGHMWKIILKNIFKRQKYFHYLSKPCYVIKSYIMILTRIQHFTLLIHLSFFFFSPNGHLELCATSLSKWNNILLCFKPKHQYFVEDYPFPWNKHTEFGGNVQINHMQRSHLRCVSFMGWFKCFRILETQCVFMSWMHQKQVTILA